MKKFPYATLERILKDAGAKRVSKDAVDAFNEILSDFADRIAIDAIRLSRHAGRKTVMGDDIKLAKR